MTQEERIEELHRRMAARKQRKENFRTAAMGTVSLMLTTVIILLVGSAGFLHTVATAGLYSGATLLLGNAGGYVLTAIIAFMSGVIITVILKKRQRKESD